jgi:hypothetical protein
MDLFSVKTFFMLPIVLFIDSENMNCLMVCRSVEDISGEDTGKRMDKKCIRISHNQ